MNHKQAVWLAWVFRVFVGGTVILWGYQTDIPLAAAGAVGTAIIILPWLIAGTQYVTDRVVGGES